MEIAWVCDRQLLYSRMAPLVQRKVISSGPARKEKADDVTMTSHCLPPCPSVSPSPFYFSRTGSQVYDVKLFPEEPVELIVGEALTLNCTALVEFNAGVDIKWAYPGKQVCSRNSWSQCCTASVTKKIGIFEDVWWYSQSVSSHQTNSSVDTKPYREALSHATEAVSILTIHSVTVTDTGPYSCNVTSMDTTQTQKTQVIVHGKRWNGPHLPLGLYLFQ